VRVSRRGGRHLTQIGASDLSVIPQPLWREAERRADVLRPLATLPVCSREDARAAAAVLGMTERQVYRLLRRCRVADGAITALIPGRSSGGRGAGRIATPREILIQETVAELYLTPQRLSAERIIVEVRRRARERGFVRRRQARCGDGSPRCRSRSGAAAAICGRQSLCSAPGLSPRGRWILCRSTIRPST
jgi:putative transposase